MRYDEKIRFVCKRFRYSVFNKDEMRTFYKSRCSRTSKVILPGTLLTDLHVKRSNKRKKFLLKIQTYKKFGKTCWLFFSRCPFDSNKQSFIQSFFGNLSKFRQANLNSFCHWQFLWCSFGRFSNRVNVVNKRALLTLLSTCHKSARPQIINSVIGNNI